MKSTDSLRQNPQFFHGIVKDIRGIVKGCLWNRQSVSRGFVEGYWYSHNRKGHPRNRNVFLE